MKRRITEVLLVDDNPADTDLIREVLARSKHSSHVSAVIDGVEAIAFLRRRGKYAEQTVPQLMVLDLNMPRKDGRAVLAEVKADSALRNIPVVVFTSSQAMQDVHGSYQLGANCYVSKPVNLQEFILAVTSIEDFWFRCAHLPLQEEQ